MYRSLAVLALVTLLLASFASSFAVPAHATPQFGDECQALRAEAKQLRAEHVRLRGKVVARRPPLPQDWRLSEHPRPGHEGLPPLGRKLWELGRRSRIDVTEMVPLGVEEDATGRTERVRIEATGLLRDVGLLAKRLQFLSGLWSVEELHAVPTERVAWFDFDVVLARRSLAVAALPGPDAEPLPLACTPTLRRELRGALQDVRGELQSLKWSIEEVRAQDEALLEALQAPPGAGMHRLVDDRVREVVWEAGQLRADVAPEPSLR